ncbi:hypothetical protein CLV31_12729 [Algoriphagus aquaeductus]|uniref:Uncharacterized protein n=1 Tax=Algoriphagus aquaeductus TaxID=475299 RepID=A0A326RJY2_9BACT|nr:hypothetical protein CLV31_12729 [Algoriphagus aquaeductus]
MFDIKCSRFTIFTVECQILNNEHLSWEVFLKINLGILSDFVANPKKNLPEGRLGLVFFRHGTQQVVPKWRAYPKGGIRIFVVMDGMIYPKYLQEILWRVVCMHDIMHP